MVPVTKDQKVNYDFSKPLASDSVGLHGDWTVEKERITSGSDTSTLSLNFNASKVYLVLGGSNSKNLPVTVQVDGKASGKSIPITMDKKYDIVDLGDSASRHTVEVFIPSGISAYAFTFGE